MAEKEPLLAQTVDNVEIDARLPDAPAEMQTDPDCDIEVDTPAELPKVRRKIAKKKHEEEGIVAGLCAWLVDHQIGEFPRSHCTVGRH
jgi:hypothetical protein